MNKKEFIEKLSSKSKINVFRASIVLSKIIEILSETLKTEAIHIKGFGSFELKKIKDRVRYNPSAGKKVYVKNKLALKFTPSKTLEKRLNPEKIVEEKL